MFILAVLGRGTEGREAGVRVYACLDHRETTGERGSNQNGVL